MKKTNVILTAVLAVFVISAVIILTVAVASNKEKEVVPVDLDLRLLSTNIEEATDLDSANLQPITLEDLIGNFKIDNSWVKNFIGKIPSVNISASTYVIIEATDGNVENIKNAFEEYGVEYESLWKDYLADEYELVQNRKIGSKGNYVYFIVDTYAQDIIDLIK